MYTDFKKNPKHISRIFLLVCLTIFSTILLSSCTPLNQTPIACTKIGCTDGIILKLNSALPSTAIIEISYGKETKTLSCSQSNCLGKSILIADITPETFTVKITNNGSVLAESSHTPAYTLNQPNGPDCPPKCNQTEVNIAI